MNWTIEELQERLKSNPALKCRDHIAESGKIVKEPKYHNKSERFDGHYFPSQAEKHRYCELKILKTAGIIKEFGCQPKFDVGAGISYKPDFEVEYWDHIEYEEVKGKWTEPSKMRVKLFKEKYPEKILKIIRNGVIT